LNAKTGKIVETFGDNGAIDLEKDVDRDLTHGETIVATTPGGIYHDLLIVSTRDEKLRGRPRPGTSAHMTRGPANGAGSFTRFRIRENSAMAHGRPTPGRPPPARTAGAV
jgi:hypothetical protein